MKITVEAKIAAPIEEVWRAWTTPEDIQQWNAASGDWHTTAATVDLREGGAFSSRMEAKDGSMGFDFAGTYTCVIPHQLIESSLGGRTILVEFLPGQGGHSGHVTVRETFDSEPTHSEEQPRHRTCRQNQPLSIVHFSTASSPQPHLLRSELPIGSRLPPKHFRKRIGLFH
jgi:uncharacterized protein YndB with AHSA1/START domain